MNGDSSEYAKKMTRLVTLIGDAVAKEELTNSQTIDLIAGLLTVEIWAARASHGQDGVTAALERFFRRVSSGLPGFDFKLMETRTDK